MKSKIRADIINSLFDLLINSRLSEIVGMSSTNETLSSVCSTIYRYPTCYGFEYDTRGHPFIKIGDIPQDGLLTYSSKMDMISDEINDMYPLTKVELGDIIMAVRGDGSTCKRIGIVVDSKLIGSNISPNLLLIRAKQDVSPVYLFQYLNSPIGQREMEQYITKTAKKTVTSNNLKKVSLYLPPLCEQKSFQNYVQQINIIKKQVSQILFLLDQLVKSRFIEMFGHQDRNEKGFKVSTIGESCIIRDSERIPVTSSEREPGPYPYYGANGLQDYVNDYIFDGDFVLMAEDGGYFDDPERPIAYAVSGKCWVNNHAHILEPGREMNVHYLEWALKYRDITNVINGTTRSKLTQAAMRSIQLLVPPIELQDNFASFLLQVDKSKFEILKTVEKIANNS